MPELTGTSITAWVYGRGHSAAAVRDAVRSLAAQSRDVDILCLVASDAAPALAGLPARLMPIAPDQDEAAVLGAALETTLTDYVVWLDAGSTAARGSLAAITAALDRFAPDLAYGDSRERAGIVRRPVFSPVRLRSQDYLGGLRALSVAHLRAHGGFRPGLDGAHAYDAALRTTADRALHIPDVLSTTTARAQEPAAHVDALRAALAEQGLDATVSRRPDGSRELDYPVRGEPLVSIIIPTRGGSATIRGRSSVLVVDAVRGVLERSTYPHLEVVVVADDATPQAVVDELRTVAGERLRLVRWSGPFNFSGKLNRGAAYAQGEYLVLLNDDVELVTPEWIEVMLGLAQQDGVGLVGTMLQFEDGAIQHGGHLYRDSGAGHIAFRWPIERDDALGSLGVDREVSGVTAACAMVSAAAYRAVGGFSSLFPGNYNDVDFCLKVRSRGDSIIWTPRARLYHFESKTRVASVAPVEIEALRQRWGRQLLVDPYWP